MIRESTSSLGKMPALLHLVYSPQRQRFILKRGQYNHSLQKKVAQIPLECAIDDSLFVEMRFEMNGGFGETAFSSFKENHLGSLVKQGYQFTFGVLGMETDETSNTRLSFVLSPHHPPQGKLELVIGEDFDLHKAERLKTWFTTLCRLDEESLLVHKF